MKPKVSILWVNYNSSNFIDIALESLKAVKDLDYPDYELIIVDNGSVDKSFGTVKEFVNTNNIPAKLIDLEKNLGFTGGNNAAYAARNRDSKYIILLNNDAVPRQDSLAQLVDFMENDEHLGAAQGEILNYDEKSIDTAGNHVSELFDSFPLLGGSRPNSLRKPIFITYADAGYSIHRIKAIKKITGQNDTLFDNYIFACFDDFILGLKTWNKEFRIKAFPQVTAKHKKGSSFKEAMLLQAYLIARNLVILNELSNSRYKSLIRLLALRQLSSWLPSRIIGLNAGSDYKKLPAAISKGFADGIRIGLTRRKQGETIDIYKAPILKVELSTALLGMIRKQISYQKTRRAQNRIAY